MSHLIRSDDFHSKIPGNVPRGRPETLDMDPKCEMRKSENIFYISSHQEMPATNITIATVKKNLGYGPKTRYQTMLKNPTRRLSPFVYPSMTVDELKILVLKTNSRQLTQQRRQFCDNIQVRKTNKPKCWKHKGRSCLPTLPVQPVLKSGRTLLK